MGVCCVGGRRRLRLLWDQSQIRVEINRGGKTQDRRPAMEYTGEPPVHWSGPPPLGPVRKHGAHHGRMDGGLQEGGGGCGCVRAG